METLAEAWFVHYYYCSSCCMFSDNFVLNCRICFAAYSLYWGMLYFFCCTQILPQFHA